VNYVGQAIDACLHDCNFYDTKARTTKTKTKKKNFLAQIIGKDPTPTMPDLSWLYFHTHELPAAISHSS
jgi:hypothetical protein